MPKPETDLTKEQPLAPPARCSPRASFISMRRDGLRRGIVTLCIGGGQSIALALETVH